MRMIANPHTPSPNVVIKEEPDFYISYVPDNKSSYASDTTAIVTQKDKQPDKFYILNGNHSQQLKTLDLPGCLEYFKNNIHQVNKHSDRIVNGEFISRKFRAKISEKGLDDGGVASFVFEVDQLVKDKIYLEQDSRYITGNQTGVVIDDNSCWWHIGTTAFNERFEIVIP